MLYKAKKEKIFCIGYGKTGTTTLEKTLKEFNYKMGDQYTGELLVFDWFNKDFSKIIKLYKSLQNNVQHHKLLLNDAFLL